MAAQNSGRTAGPRGRPFPPGVSGNEGGRPKKDRPLLDALRDVVDPVKLAKKLWQIAMAGDLLAIKYIYDRDLGTPMQRHTVTIDDVREKARRTAEEQGLDPEELVREAEAIFRGERLS